MRNRYLLLISCCIVFLIIFSACAKEPTVKFEDSQLVKTWSGGGSAIFASASNAEEIMLIPGSEMKDEDVPKEISKDTIVCYLPLDNLKNSFGGIVGLLLTSLGYSYSLPLAIEFTTSSAANNAVSFYNKTLYVALNLISPERMELKYVLIEGTNIVVFDICSIEYFIKGEVIKEDDVIFSSDKKVLISFLKEDILSYSVPNGVETIGRFAFFNCQINKINLPSSLKEVKNKAFGYSIYTAFINAEAVPKISVNGVWENSEVMIFVTANSVSEYKSKWKENADNIFSQEIINDESFAIDDGTLICYFGEEEELTLPSSVTGIKKTAFSMENNIKKIYVPSSVTYIEEDAFSGCHYIEEITLPFIGCSIQGNNIDELKLEYIFGYIPYELKKVVITGGINVNIYAFADCVNLISIILPDSVTSIGDYAFSGCSGLTSVTIPGSVTSIGSWAFYNCSGLTSVTIGEGVTSIGEGAFFGCNSLTSLTIPDSVTSIEDRAFCNCSGLTSVTIPDSMTSIGDGAFSGCSGLTSVTIPDSMTSIGDRAFFGCSGLTSVTIGNIVTSIGSWAFYNCSGLILIIIPNSVTSIGDRAFSGCSGLTSITIPDSVTSIGNEAFFHCSGLNSIVVNIDNTVYKSESNCLIEISTNILILGCNKSIIPDDVTSIGNGAFYDCNGLTSLTIPDSVMSIGDNAFSVCSGLTSITIPNSVTSIGSWAFSSCSKLTSITIPNSVTSIGDYAFSGCGNLTSITIPNSVTSIGISAFYACISLASVTFTVTNGWYSTTSSSENSGTSMVVTDPETNAINLNSTYVDYYWKRNT